MNLSQQLMADMKDAMRNKEALKKGVLTLIRAGLSAAEKEKKTSLTEAEEVAVLQRELKQNRQTLTEAQKAQRSDIEEVTLQKISIIQSYLPKMMDEKEIISFLEAHGVKKGDHIGKIIGILMKENKGKVDGTFAKEVIQKHFS